MIPFTTNTDLTFSIPQGWHEVTVRMYADLNKYRLQIRNDFVRVLSILSRVPYETLFTLPEDKIFANIVPMLSWMNEKFEVDNLPTVEEFFVQGKLIKVPEKITKLSWGQRIIAESRIKPLLDNEENLFTFIPIICSIYLSEQYFGKEFDAEKIDEFTEILWDEPIINVYPVGAFFLPNLTKLLRMKTPDLPQHKTRNSLRQVLENLMCSVRKVFSSRSQTKTQLNLSNT